MTNQYWYGYNGAGDAPDYVRSGNWEIVEKTLQLPGGVNATIKPKELNPTSTKIYELLRLVIQVPAMVKVRQTEPLGYRMFTM